jgi:hypothetical protein
MSLNESILEDAALNWFGVLGYAVEHGPHRAPEIAWRSDKLTAPMMAKVKANANESRTLATLRCTLLPKLLSGESCVSKVASAGAKARTAAGT